MCDGIESFDRDSNQVVDGSVGLSSEVCSVLAEACGTVLIGEFRPQLFERRIARCSWVMCHDDILLD